MSAVPHDPRATQSPALTRRRFLGGGARLALAAAAVGLPSLSLGCWNPTSPGPVTPRGGDGRLQSRAPATPPTTSLAPGLHELDFIPERRGLLYVPEGHAADTPAPLVVSFHGAGGTAAGWMSAGWPGLADAAGVLILAPEALGSTWEAIHAPFGPDLAFVDAALAWTLERCAVDPTRITAHGFSDGGTYALSVGLANGDLFHRVVAHSPGFIVDAPPHGRPPVLVTHGTSDGVLPIDQTSRRIVAYLRDHGYTVDFREFAGGHQVPASLAAAGLEWAAAP
jgi:predicted esterase